MRKKYGNTWWGQQWLNALSQIDFSNRLPRGRTYANRGAARDILINNNTITAKVDGSRPRPYEVQIQIPEFSIREKAQILEMVTSNPLFLSKLIIRELPEELYELTSASGIDLFPGSWYDLEGSCSCPDWAVPCKHLAAVLYLISNEIDKNPFLIFALHGFDLFRAIESLGYSFEEQQQIDIARLEDLWSTPEEPPPYFEWSDELYESLDFSKIPDIGAQLIDLLPDQPVFFPSGDFKPLLKKAYHETAREQRRSGSRFSEGDLTGELLRIKKCRIFLDNNLQFLRGETYDYESHVVESFTKNDAFLEWLEQLPFNHLSRLADDLKALLITYRLAEKLAEKGAVIPNLLQLAPEYFLIRWIPAYLNEQVWEVADLVETLTPFGLIRYEVDGQQLEPVEEDAFTVLIHFFLTNLTRMPVKVALDWMGEPVCELFFSGRPVRFDQFETRSYPAALQLWLQRFYISGKEVAPILQIEEENGHFKVQLGVEDTSDDLRPIYSLTELFENDQFSNIRHEVLQDLAMLTDSFPQISSVIASRGREKLLFDGDDFVEVLFSILPTIELLGIRVLLPKALRKLIRPQLSMEMKSDPGIVAPSSLISLENMLRFDWTIALGDQHLSPEAFLEQVQRLSGIVKIHEEFAYFNPREIQKLIDQIEHPPRLNKHQVLQAALTEEFDGAPIKLDQNVRDLIDQLLKGEGVELPKGLHATLRPYQLRGYEWLYKNTRLGFGSLIADDMGLGKTIQVLSLLLKLKEDGELGKQKGLIIVPTTLLTNWGKEILKFTPDLQFLIYHGPGRSLDMLEEVDLIITTYGVVRTEAAQLQKKDWLIVVIDEAQNIKNPATGQTKAVKKVPASIQVAMSGTPVENRLSEYWSIFDYSNKGYLGGLKKFKDRYAKPIEIDRDQKQLDRFRKITAPFILRRTKTDKSIIPDLPDKIEKDQYCVLTPQQAAIYQNVLDQNLKQTTEAEGINRQGLVLKLITALKQICNHPDHFLKKGLADPGLSGKSDLLLDLLTQILENEEKTLIFTQYREMGELLTKMLQTAFGLEVPFLHGGVPRKKRDEMVDRFQEDRSIPIFLLSLKAAGTGLNLTAASNVIHYDLWWNPAVEAQATDRAYRIGQQRNVMVHRFITKGTFEEKINQMIQNKKELADLTVATGEKWIGDLSNRELKELVQLENPQAAK
jgi:SNF2 family DNA or RNA helicase/uncharacterized Zn finger protein